MTNLSFCPAGARRALGGFLAAVLVSLAAFLGIGPTSALADDVSSLYVTGITTDSTTYDSYSTVACTLTFSASGSNQIGSRDTITASWSPATDTITATGYSNTLDITLESDPTVVIGTAVVTDAGVTITFNDNVENYQNVSGSVTFSISVVNTGTEGGTVEISSGEDVATTITVSPSTASGDEPAYKTGYWSTGDPSVVYWAFRVNRTYSDTFDSDVKITDEIPSGLSYTGITAIHVYTSGDELAYGADTSSKITELMSKLGIIAEYDSGTGTLTVTIPQELASYYYIYFEFGTTVSDSSALGASVTNTATANYATDGDDVIDHSISETLAVPSSSASSDGDDLGTISVLKEVEGTTVPISRVTFRVYMLDGEGGDIVSSAWYDSDGDGVVDAAHADITTDSTGVATLEGLVDGYYELEETSGPSWVVLSTQKVPVKVASGETASVTVDNAVATTDVSVTKEWDDGGDADDVRPSAGEFASWLTLEANGEEVEGATPTVVDNGDGTYTVTYADVDAYDSQGNAIEYTVVETIPSDYDYYTADASSVANGGTIVNTYEPDGSDTSDGSSSSDASAVSGKREAAVPVTGDTDILRPILVIVVVACALVALALYLRRRGK